MANTEKNKAKLTPLVLGNRRMVIDGDMKRWRTRAGKVNGDKSTNVELIHDVALDVQAWGIAA